MDEQLATYADEALKQGVTDARAQAMCVNFRHQGGQGAVTRILAKTQKPYTLDNLYAACQTDTGNQVGAYESRQRFVYDALKTYFPESEETDMNAIDKLIQIAKNETGYLEKASNSQLDSKTANAGSANFTKYWRDVLPEWNGSYWCAVFIAWCFMKAFGLETAKKLLKHWPYVYCPDMQRYFKLNANPKVGDIVIFWSSKKKEFVHTGLVTAIIGDRFYTIEGNTSGASDVIVNGGGVCAKSYLNSQMPGTKFCTPDYSLVTSSTESTTGGSYMFTPETVKAGDKNTSVLLLQEILRARGFKGKTGKALKLTWKADANTIYALKTYQESRKEVLAVDGVCGPATWKDLIAI